MPVTVLFASKTNAAKYNNPKEIQICLAINDNGVLKNNTTITTTPIVPIVKRKSEFVDGKLHEVTEDD